MGVVVRSLGNAPCSFVGRTVCSVDGRLVWGDDGDCGSSTSSGTPVRIRGKEMMSSIIGEGKARVSRDVWKG